eukprot:scaffold100795_cov21-Tisochrysis_lutea.AAC.2
MLERVAKVAPDGVPRERIEVVQLQLRLPDDLRGRLLGRTCIPDRNVLETLYAGFAILEGLESASARPSQIWLHYPGSAVCQSCGAVWGDHAVDKKEVDTEQVGFKYKH